MVVLVLVVQTLDSLQGFIQQLTWCVGYCVSLRAESGVRFLGGSDPLPWDLGERCKLPQRGSGRIWCN